MATITLNTTKGELVDLMNGLFNSQDIKGKDFALTVSKNISILQKALADIEEIGRPSEEFVKFAHQIKSVQEAGDQEGVKKMESENAELLAERKLQIEKVQKELKKDAKVIELNVLTKTMLPNDVTARQVGNLEKIII